MRELLFNKHARDYTGDFTIEFNVKRLGRNAKLPDDIWSNESENGTFASMYCQKCFDEIMKSGYDWIKEWGIAGRSGGWFVLVCEGDEDKIPKSTLTRIENIVNKYIDNYDAEIQKFYTTVPLNSKTSEEQYTKTIKDLKKMYKCLDNISLPASFADFDLANYSEQILALQQKLISHIDEILEAEKKYKEYRLHLLIN